MRLDASVISNIAILKTLFDLLYSRVVLSVDQGLSGFKPPNLFNFVGRLFFKSFLANLPWNWSKLTFPKNSIFGAQNSNMQKSFVKMEFFRMLVVYELSNQSSFGCFANAKTSSLQACQILHLHSLQNHFRFRLTGGSRDRATLDDRKCNGHRQITYFVHIFLHRAVIKFCWLYLL